MCRCAVLRGRRHKLLWLSEFYGIVNGMGDKTGAAQFSAREIKYLESLPAVEHASKERIKYTSEFRRECMRLYAQGESPVRIFRSAGLDPSLIGYKRIERCIARWKRTAALTGGLKAVQDGTANRDASSSGGDTGTASELKPSLKKPRAKRKHWRASLSPVPSLRLLEETLQDDAEHPERPAVLSIASPDRVDSANRDIYGLIIIQQARKIEELEHQIDVLRERLNRLQPQRQSA